MSLTKKVFIPTIILAIILLIAAVASAVDSEFLVVESIRVDVDGDRDTNVDPGDTIKVKPGSELMIEVRVENLYDDTTENDLEDVFGEAILESIDDGDDLETEYDEFDLNTERSKSIRFNFQIPLKVDGETVYDLIIDIEGEDQNGTIHTIDLDFEVEVDKDNHEIGIFDIALEPDTIDCSRRARLKARVINIGKSSEDDVTFSVNVDTLGTIFSVKFDLDDDYLADDNEYVFNKIIDFANIRAGTYSAYLKTKYYNNNKEVTERISLVVDECKVEEPEPTPPAPEPTPPAPTPDPQPDTGSSNSGSTTTQVTTTPSTSTSAQQRDNYRPVAITRTSSDSSDTNKWIIVILVTDVALVILGVLIYAGLKKKKGSNRMY